MFSVAQIITLATIHCVNLSNTHIDFDIDECNDVIIECLFDDSPRYCLSSINYTEITKLHYD